MALGSVGSLGTANSVTANQASLALVTTATLEAGNVAVLAIAVDNNQTTDGDEGAVTSVTDSVGNTWLKAAEFTNGQAAAQGGATCSVWYTKATTQLSSGGTITINFSNSASRDASAATAHEFTVAAGTTVSVQGTATLANDAADAGSLDVTTPNAAFLRFRATASENNQTGVWTNTAGWTNVTQAIGDTGSAAGSQSIRAEFIISTATGAASDPATNNRDHASVYVAFKEAVDLISGLADIAEAGDTVAATGVLPIAGTVSATEQGDALASTGTLAIKAAASITEGDDTLASAGTRNALAALAVTEAGDTVSADATGEPQGAVNIAEAGDTVSATAVLPVKGLLAVTEAGDSVAATGKLLIQGVVAITEASDVSVTDGHFVNKGGVIAPVYDVAVVGWGAVRAYPQIIFDFAIETPPRALPEAVAPVTVAPVRLSDQAKLARYAEAAAAFDMDLVMKYLAAVGIDVRG